MNNARPRASGMIIVEPDFHDVGSRAHIAGYNDCAFTTDEPSIRKNPVSAVAPTVAITVPAGMSSAETAAASPANPKAAYSGAATPATNGSPAVPSGISRYDRPELRQAIEPVESITAARALACLMLCASRQWSTVDRSTWACATVPS